MAALLRARDIPIGVVSDGRWWALVWAPPGKPVGAGVWDAGLWSEEPESLEAFVALLERRRFLGVQPADRLPALLEESASAQEEVTTTLGVQVRMAVEMLVRRLDELDRQADGTLLKEVSDDDLYAGVVTVMMRLVFLLFAEERRLLPSDDAHYDTSYSAGRLVEQLEQRAALHGEQTLEHRTGAWHRLLALARALHGGVAHEDLRLPPYGGGLFDPDRYRWLEGLDGKPPPVDDLTVLRMLEAVQYVHLRGERRRLTFRSLDVEQIGYVYEGLLELEVRTAVEPILALRRQGRKSLTLISVNDALEAMDDLETWTATTYTGEKKATPARRKSAARWLAEEVSPATLAGLRLALGTDLGNRLQPLGPLLARDERDRPVITPGGGRYVAPSTRRSATGAHYTPRSLAEEVVQHSLEPLCYRPGPLETLARERWVLRPSTDLLALRVADIAMGSGAFLVAACRFLADRVVEAWDTEGDTEATAALGRRGPQTSDTEVEGVLLRARRLVAEHCLYGVDINPLAVEMAKLSLWLVTMDRERPFGFLDDRLVCGDSLLGVVSLSQLEEIHLDPEGARRRRAGAFDFGIGSREMLARAADTRRRITATPVTTVRDVEHKTRLLHEAERASAPLLVIADALTGAGLMAASLSPGHRNAVFARLEDAFRVVDSGKDPQALEPYTAAINAGLPEGKEPRRPLHWPLAFPEVFADTAVPGFDAIVGNPPFLGGKKISGALGGDYLSWLAAWDGRGVKGNTDLAARFLLRADSLLGPRGQLGYVATNTLIEGDTLAVGLLQLERRGWTIRQGTSAHPWPSASANLSIVEIWATKAPLKAGAVLDDEPVPRLSVDLQPYLRETGRPNRLSENESVAFQGSNVLGMGFTLTPDEAQLLLAEDHRNADVLFPFVIGADLNRRPDTSASRWIINFHNWTLERAELHAVLLERVRRLVKPGRDRLPDYKKRVREAWWRYEHQAPTLYEAISTLDHVLAISRVGSVLLPVRVDSGVVFSEACVIFALDDFSSLAVLSSSAHQAWVIRYTSTMRTDIRYAPSDVFLTFPRPVPTPELHDLGKALDTERDELMLSRALGLTKLYNQVHDPTIIDPAILRLRELHREIDRAVLAAYGWDDLDPQIGHHRTKIGTRWTVSHQARFQLLDRLLVENHRRAEGT
ncbi:MAG: Eco57I restriction-modification methylase domain-containing protein [Candidatus Dormibacteria bacterium]